ncbi:MAG: class I SAM-dependent methyltransferase [Candidatus Solibacter usitatus]|nr:class I SAM-dependent methyltransferase [Candidatus Solibacter usitatus]
MEAQSFSVKRAEVEFHNFASFGEPERAIAAYHEENVRRGAVIRNHLGFIGEMSPFLEIGSAAGHSSYMLVNEFGAEGFALDLSADALRYGRVLMERWELERAPVRLAGDALHLPFADDSLRMVMAFQMLSQFQDIDAVFAEVKRVLEPGGVFLFAEEPIRRMLSLRLYRAPYLEQMKPWEKKLDEWGLLGYLAKDVIGARQEESFGIRQNHRMTLWDWDRTIRKHFVDHEYELFVARRGWGESAMYRMGQRLDRCGSDWVPARLLGGTLAAVCRKGGEAGGTDAARGLETLLRCPDCRGELRREAESLRCGSCGYEAAEEGGVYNLLPSAERKELYPGARADVIDFTEGDCAERLLEGFHELEGVYGNKYRWVSERAVFRLERVNTETRRLRVRGFAGAPMLELGQPARVEIRANGATVYTGVLDRPGLFVIEAPLAEAESYVVEFLAGPKYRVPPDERWFTVNLSLMRLV